VLGFDGDCPIVVKAAGIAMKKRITGNQATMMRKKVKSPDVQQGRP
jgi:hypothetical protein